MKQSNNEFKQALIQSGQLPSSTQIIEKDQIKLLQNSEKSPQTNKKKNQIKTEKIKKNQEKSQSKLINLKKEISHENNECNEQDLQVYGTWLKTCVREGIEENEILRQKIMELEALFAAAQDEIDIRNKAILELSNALDELKLENIQLKQEVKSASVEEKIPKKIFF